MKKRRGHSYFIYTFSILLILISLGFFIIGYYNSSDDYSFNSVSGKVVGVGGDNSGCNGYKDSVGMLNIELENFHRVNDWGFSVTGKSSFILKNSNNFVDSDFITINYGNFSDLPTYLHYYTYGGASKYQYRFYYYGGQRMRNKVPLAGDFNGDGVDEIGLYAPFTGIFQLKNSNDALDTSENIFQYGPIIKYNEIPNHVDQNNRGVIVKTYESKNLTMWYPLVGDWDGDGKDSVGLFDPLTSTFYLRNSNTPGEPDIIFSIKPPYGDKNYGIPIAGDWDGDGKDTVGFYFDKYDGSFFYDCWSSYPYQYEDVPGCSSWDPAGMFYSPQNHFIIFNENKNTSFSFDKINATLTFNQISKTEQVFFSNERFYNYFVKNYPDNRRNYSTTQFYFSTAVFPLVGDWDGDGKDGIGLYQPIEGNFYLKNKIEGTGYDISFYSPKYMVENCNHLELGCIPLAGNWNGDCLCKPNCTNRECGSDGCNGYCGKGICENNGVCSEDGKCLGKGILDVDGCLNDNGCSKDYFFKNYCKDNNVYHDSYNYSCRGIAGTGICGFDTTPTKVKDCTGLFCKDGACVENIVPIGNLDGIIGNIAVGWSCDPSDFKENISIQINEVVNGVEQWVNNTIANISSQQNIDDKCGGIKNHRFNFTIPDRLKDGMNHTLKFYSINYPPGTNVFLRNITYNSLSSEQRSNNLAFNKPTISNSNNILIDLQGTFLIDRFEFYVSESYPSMGILKLLDINNQVIYSAELNNHKIYYLPFLINASKVHMYFSKLPENYDFRLYSSENLPKCIPKIECGNWAYAENSRMSDVDFDRFYRACSDLNRCDRNSDSYSSHYSKLLMIPDKVLAVGSSNDFEFRNLILEQNKFNEYLKNSWPCNPNWTCTENYGECINGKQKKLCTDNICGLSYLVSPYQRDCTIISNTQIQNNPSNPTQNTQSNTAQNTNSNSNSNSDSTTRIISSCTNECNLDGKKECTSVNSYRVCGNFDSDSCLEFGNINYCTNSACVNGECVSNQITANPSTSSNTNNNVNLIYRNVALNQLISVDYGSDGKANAVDGSVYTSWNAGPNPERQDRANLTINLDKSYYLKNYTIHCAGSYGGNIGNIYFINANEQVQVVKHYNYCNYSNIYEGTSGELNNISVKKVIIAGKQAIDNVNVVEFEIYGY